MSKINDLIKELCPNGVKYKTIKEFTKVLRGKRLTTKELCDDASFPVYHGGLDPLGYYHEFNRIGDTVMVINVGASAGTVGYSKCDFWSSDGCYCIEHNDILLNKYLYHYLKNNENYFMGRVRKAGIPTLDSSVIEKFKIAIPPLEVQEEIVRILDKFGKLEAELEAELEVRKIQYEFWRRKLLNNEKYESVKINDIAYNVSSGKCNSRNEDGVYPVYGSTGIIARTDEYLYETEKILIARVGANAGYVHIANGKYNVTDNTLILDLKDNVDLRFMYYYLQNYNLNKLAKGGGQPLITGGQIKDLDICLPPIQEQKRISNILDKFDKLINDISEGIPAEIEFRRKQYEYYRNMLLSFEEVS